MTPPPIPLLQFLLTQALEVLSQGVADQRRPIHFLPLCQTIGGSQKLCIEHDLYGFHMRTSFHSIVNMSSFPQFLIQEPVQLKVGRRSGLGTRCVNISVAPDKIENLQDRSLRFTKTCWTKPTAW